MELPFGLANITGLRHLNIAGRDGLTRLPAGLGNFQLQTLPLYIVGKEIGESISEIICLNLRGELSIRCLENIRDKEEATLANLRAKKYVELLSLQWGRGNEEKIVKLATGSTSYEVCREVDGTSRSLPRDNDIVMECILECLHPHVNLKKLISRDKCPNLITAPTFQSLLYLELRDWHPKILESVENMSSLSHLVIDALQGLMHLPVKLLENNKPLETLEILSCKSLLFRFLQK